MMMDRNTTTQLPVIGITMGDPAGIGAEVIVKALADPEIRTLGRFIIFGLNEAITYAADMAEIDSFWWRDQHDHLQEYAHRVVVADYDEFNILSSDLQTSTKPGGMISYQFLLDACDAWRNNLIHAIVTGPISKTSWQLAGIKYPGHTEFFGDQFKTKRVTMMFAGEKLKVALATIHIPLMDVRNRFTIGCVFQPMDLLHQALVEWFGIPRPKIAVCGLNPHAGEGGRFGDEEDRIIKPAITMAQEAGIDAQGPYPADTIFLQAINGKYDAVVAMYHDQGLIPIKLLAFDSSVNITLGLPFIRTSVDHGTAFDIAGKNKANPGSMKEAIKLACQMAGNQLKKAPAQRKMTWT
jgi:4-hydroxythreonine-4-phosphate dehydrogenase